MKAPSALALALSFPLAGAQAPEAARPLPPGPDVHVKITEAYAKQVGRDVHVWAWPILATYARRLVASKTTEPMVAGAFPRAPLNRLGMLTDYIDPAQRSIPAPDQDLISGMGIAALDVSPVVLQVPFLGDRFWLYQCLDARGDSFADLGSMHDDSKGTFLLVGPGWKGETPAGIKRVFRSSTWTATIVPRVYQDGTKEQNRWLQNGLEYVAMYPLSEYDGTMKAVPWRKLPRAGAAAADALGTVDPEASFDFLADALQDAPPLPGEEARYAQALAVVEAAQQNPKLKAAWIAGAKEADEQVVKPLFEYRSFGRPLAYHWSTIDNGAAFGTDYFTRTAAARSMGFAARRDEVTVYDLDTDAKGNRLNGGTAYTLRFAGPVPGAVWSLTAYNDEHLFEPNAQKRYALGSKDPLKAAADGSVTFSIQAEPPAGELRDNWLPAPRGDFSLVLRVYAPEASVLKGSWTPPPVQRVQ